LPDLCSAPEANVPTFSPANNDAAFSQQLVNVLSCAETKIQAALYQTTSQCFVDLLNGALSANPSVSLELVIDDDQCPLVSGVRDCPLSQLEGNPRVQIIDDSRSALMHHKYIIADGRRVWISSANMTEDSFCSQFNNSMVIDDPTIVGAYLTEHQRMAEMRSFGPTEDLGPTESGNYSVYFSPRSPASQPSRWFIDLLAAIETSTSSIDFMIFALTRQEVGDALVRAQERGVRVRGVVAHRFSTEPAISAMLDAGIDLRFDDVHSKVMVIDTTVVTGSANWSRSAWSNNENSLWIRDVSLADTYRAEVESIYENADPVGSGEG
jgi:phosphatidylserine/phosphatidylglycerophosphate/cardiolipin synthase-like enzyme